MGRVLRWALFLVVFGVCLGCGESTKPNPELKIPDIPPGGRDSKKPISGAKS
jgi:hypothetical protein